MEERVQAIIDGSKNDLIWLCEHPSLYTAGRSAKREDLLRDDYLPVYQSGRGGEYTYHGPGQRVIYVMINLNRYQKDIHAFVSALEAWVIEVLDAFGIMGAHRKGRPGVWIVSQGETYHEDKIAAVGVRVKKWVTSHGICAVSYTHLTLPTTSRV